VVTAFRTSVRREEAVRQPEALRSPPDLRPPASDPQKSEISHPHPAFYYPVR
jgi:hypothetical protein